MSKDDALSGVKMGAIVGYIEIGPVGKMVNEKGEEVICVFDDKTRTVTYEVKKEDK